MTNCEKRRAAKRKRREARKRRGVARVSGRLGDAAWGSLEQSRIPGTLAPLSYPGECKCGGDMVYVEGTMRECRGCNDVSVELLRQLAERGEPEEFLSHYLRRCSVCGRGDVYHMTPLRHWGRLPQEGDCFEYEHQGSTKLPS